jgi:3-oxoacyl-[acyl-carrier protein] reductase
VVSSSRSAVVTGGAGGIGGAIVAALQSSGQRVQALAGDGITVNAVAPGLTPTPAAEQGVEREAFEEVRRAQALPRAMTPEDTAAAVAFLYTDAARALTGQTLCVDGGLIFH